MKLLWAGLTTCLALCSCSQQLSNTSINHPANPEATEVGFTPPPNVLREEAQVAEGTVPSDSAPADQHDQHDHPNTSPTVVPSSGTNAEHGEHHK